MNAQDILKAAFNTLCDERGIEESKREQPAIDKAEAESWLNQLSCGLHTLGVFVYDGKYNICIY